MTVVDIPTTSPQDVFDFTSNPQFSILFVPITINKPLSIFIIFLAAFVDYFIPHYYICIASFFRTTYEKRVKFKALHKQYCALAIKILPLLGSQDHFALCALVRRRLMRIFTEMEGYHVSYWKLYDWNDAKIRQIYSIIDATDDITQKGQRLSQVLARNTFYGWPQITAQVFPFVLPIALWFVLNIYEIITGQWSQPYFTMKLDDVPQDVSNYILWWIYWASTASLYTLLQSSSVTFAALYFLIRSSFHMFLPKIKTVRDPSNRSL